MEETVGFSAIPLNEFLNKDLIFVFIFIISLVGITISIPFYIYIQGIREKSAYQKQQNYVLKKILDTAPEARCWWSKPDDVISFTQGFVDILGLNKYSPIHLVDLTNQFVENDSFLIDKYIQALVKYHHPFELEAHLSDKSLIINIRGSVQGEYHYPLFALSLNDVTETQQENRRQLQLLAEMTAERNRLQTMVDVAPIALWYRNRENQIAYCNVVYASVLESTPSEILEHSRELVDRFRAISPYQLAVKAKTTGLVQKQQTHLVIEGCRRLVEMTEVPLAEQECTIGYAFDLTETEEATAKLAKHMEAHKEVLHYLSTPIAIYGPDTRLEFFNTAFLKLFQFDEVLLHKKPTFSDILQDLRERRKLPEYSDFKAFRRDQLQLFNTLIHPIQELLHQPDGHILRVMVAPHPLGGLFFLYEDVSDKLALERQYNTLIAVQKETIDHLYEGIVVFGSDFRLRLHNPAVARIWQLDSADLQTGNHAGEILDRVQPSFVGYRNWGSFKNKLLGMISQRQARTGRFHRQDHSMVQYSYVPLPDGSHLLSFVDVSDRWRFEQALQERNDALERADRLKSDFISNVSYELKAPLNTIIGFTEILTNQYFGHLTERQLDYCRGISESSHRLLSLINDILDLASIEAGQFTLKLQVIDLESFLSSLTGLVYNRSHDQGLETIKENKTSIKNFVGDERRLKQAIFNLLTNAIKFTPSGGSIALKSFIDQHDNSLCFSVSDTGIGIENENQQRLFQLFETGNKSNQAKQKGMGLGLPLVKSFVELHGGGIDIQSQAGKGTTVTVRIPLHLSVPEPVLNQPIMLNENLLMSQVN